MGAVHWLIDEILFIYMLILIAHVIMSWLVAFKMVNTQNQIIYQIGTALYRMTEPVLGPIRRFLPNMGGIDLSPLVVLILIIFIRKLLNELFVSIT
ncbi:MAG: YggT family protein [Pseudomonadota bacterium]